MDFQKSKTKENLARAFAAECQDGARYQFMAKEAMKESLSNISDQLKQLAKNEMAHAMRFYELMLEHCQGKEDNVPIEAGYPFEPSALKVSLKTASTIEEYEAKNIYPSFARVAQDEGFMDIAQAFKLIAEVEQIHFQKLLSLANMYKGGKLYKSANKMPWTCGNCGHKHEAKEAWKNCPLCAYPQGYVIISMNE